MPLPQACVVLFLLLTIEARLFLSQQLLTFPQTARFLQPCLHKMNNHFIYTFSTPIWSEQRCLYAYCTDRYSPPAAG